MASSLMEPQNSSNSSHFSHLIGENYHLSLNQSLQNLKDSAEKTPNFDFSSFTPTFSELMRSRPNPPLETIWVYTGLTFRSTIAAKGEHLHRLSAIKDLFQSIQAFSASCSSLKSIALLAPVIYQLYSLIVELGDKKEEKVKREIKSLLDSILGYIGICCSRVWNDEDCSIRSLEELVLVWIGGGEEDSFKLFFPCLGDEIIERIRNEGCEVDQLAGIVIAEAFLLKLCLDFRPGIAKSELRNWAVGSITGFQNVCFYGILVEMLLMPTLPVTSLLNTEDEKFLRSVLYDAIILVDYSFLHPGRLVHLPTQRVNSLMVARLILTHESTELYMKGGDHTKAISYINAFSSSQIPSQLIKWVAGEIGTGHKASKLNRTSPKAFLLWLTNLENQGITLLEGGITKFGAKLLLDISKVDSEELTYKGTENKSDGDLLFIIDKKGEEEDGNGDNDNDDDDEKTKESMSAAFVAAAQKMKPLETPRAIKRKGRKEGKSIEPKKKVKFQKHELPEKSVSLPEEFAPLGKDGSNSDSEVENPVSDDEDGK